MHKSQSGRLWWVFWVSAADLTKNQVGITRRGNDGPVELGYQKGCKHLTCHQFSSVTQSYPILCDPMNCSTPGLPVHHHFPVFTQTHVHRVHDAIQPSHPVIPFSSCPQSLPASESFPMSQPFARGGQSIGVSASTSVLPMNTQN